MTGFTPKSTAFYNCPKEAPMSVHGRANLEGSILTITRKLNNGQTVTKTYRVEKMIPQSVIADPLIRLHGHDGRTFDIGCADGFCFCDCWDFLSRRERRDPEGCKHIRAARATGLIR